MEVCARGRVPLADLPVDRESAVRHLAGQVGSAEPKEWLTDAEVVKTRW
jgi:hypothetical protein